MSFARWSDDSDVYVILNAGGYLDCMGCGPDGCFTLTERMIAHLKEHEAEGDKVPERTFERLRVEAEKNDAWMANSERQRSPRNHSS